MRRRRRPMPGDAESGRERRVSRAILALLLLLLVAVIVWMFAWLADAWVFINAWLQR